MWTIPPWSATRKLKLHKFDKNAWNMMEPCFDIFGPMSSLLQVPRFTGQGASVAAVASTEQTPSRRRAVLHSQHRAQRASSFHVASIHHQGYHVPLHTPRMVSVLSLCHHYLSHLLNWRLPHWRQCLHPQLQWGEGRPGASKVWTTAMPKSLPLRTIFPAGALELPLLLEPKWSQNARLCQHFKTSTSTVRPCH